MNNNKNNTFSDIRIAASIPKSRFSGLLKFISPLLDRILGIDKLKKLYETNQLAGLEKQTFSTTLIASLGVSVFGEKNILSQVPNKGPCIVVCNHPYGMVEGVIIAKLLTSYRSDTKVMANVGLKVFKEINEYFIFANPLKPKAAINTSAIKQCFKHLNNDGLLVIFPAGRVSFYDAKYQRIIEGEWNRIAIQLAKKTQSPILPVYISGANSPLFHQLGRVYYRFRLLMLAREMFKLEGHTINLTTNGMIEHKQLIAFNGTAKMNDFVRLQCLLNDSDYFTPWLADNKSLTFKEIIPPADKDLMQDELSHLPKNQRLVNFKSYTVYYGYQQQIPTCVQEITRLREITFRTLDEGSGEDCDTDKYDDTYLHLFIFDHRHNEIIGAYRIGQSDLLLKNSDKSALYLSQMFNFQDEFINQQQPCLEMGRSFIVAAHQNSFHGLLLLWKGIGAYVCQFPQYRTLYGTVSLSKLYDPRSVAIINEVMITDKKGVTAKTEFSPNLHPEVKDFINNNELTQEQLSAMVMGIERDNKDIPVLLKQYHKLGAKFHCTGIDSNFNHTPGLLLSVHLPSAPEKLLKLYLGKGKDDYVQFCDAQY